MTYTDEEIEELAAAYREADRMGGYGDAIRAVLSRAAELRAAQPVAPAAVAPPEALVERDIAHGIANVLAERGVLLSKNDVEAVRALLAEHAGGGR